MRHRKSGTKLNRTSSHRKAMFRNMVTSIFKYEKIKTTDVKAKELRSWADNIITLAKRGDLHARRQVLSIIREKDVAHKLFEEAQEKFGKVSGGYTRITKLGFRNGDAACVSIIELITDTPKKKKAKKVKVRDKKAKENTVQETKEIPKKDVEQKSEKEAKKESVKEITDDSEEVVEEKIEEEVVKAEK